MEIYAVADIYFSLVLLYLILCVKFFFPVNNAAILKYCPIMVINSHKIKNMIIFLYLSKKYVSIIISTKRANVEMTQLLLWSIKKYSHFKISK